MNPKPQTLEFKPQTSGCGDRIGTGPPRARTEVIHVDLGYWAVSGSIHPKGDPRSWGKKTSVFRAGQACPGGFRRRHVLVGHVQKLGRDPLLQCVQVLKRRVFRSENVSNSPRGGCSGQQMCRIRQEARFRVSKFLESFP